MSPAQFHGASLKRDNGLYPPPLKINKDSHFIKKTSSSSSSSSSVSSLGVAGPSKPQQRHPVIIYTHSPKVIHTHPRDFMALVQKLTGLSRSDEERPSQPKVESGNASPEEDSKSVKIGGSNDDNESSSVITDENCDHQGQINSCFLPPIFDPPPPPFLSNVPVFTPNSAEFLCTNQPFYNYTDSLFFTPSMRSSISSSSSALDALNEFREF